MFNWRFEYGDVVFLFGCLFGGLVSDMFFGVRDDYVERCKGVEVICFYVEDFSLSGSGDVDGYFERWFEGK